MMLDCGYLRRDAEAAASAIRDFAAAGHLELMRQIALLHSPRRGIAQIGSSCLIIGLKLVGALHKSCECASRRRKSNRADQERSFYPGIKLSQRTYHFGGWRRSLEDCTVVSCEQQIAKNHDQPLERAFRNGHLKCVEVMIQNLLITKKRPGVCPMNAAAADSGRLEMSNGYTLTAGGLGGGGRGMDAAAEGGHVHVAKRLHLNRNRGYTKYAMRVAATLGHLPVVQLLHSYCDKGCVKDAIDCAAKSGHLDIVKWIDVNKLVNCSDDAVKVICRIGPLRVTSWLHTHFPEQTAVRLNDVPHTLRTGKFELLLFVYAHSPQCINQRYKRLYLQIFFRVLGCKTTHIKLAESKMP
ncbi:Ankyrin repeat-containing domain [Phytophthora cactorum]|nr:Ankyrin repeat-containing domain [Phytophthora cactorum]